MVCHACREHDVAISVPRSARIGHDSCIGAGTSIADNVQVAVPTPLFSTSTSAMLLVGLQRRMSATPEVLKLHQRYFQQEAVHSVTSHMNASQNVVTVRSIQTLWPTCCMGLQMEASVIGRECDIGRGAVIRDSYIGSGVTVHENAVLCGALVLEGAVIHEDARLLPGSIICYKVPVRLCFSLSALACSKK